jgi:hypothetical protein
VVELFELMRIDPSLAQFGPGMTKLELSTLTAPLLEVGGDTAKK